MFCPPSSSPNTTATTTSAAIRSSFPLFSARNPPRRRTTPICSLPVTFPSPASCRIPPPSRSTNPLQCTACMDVEGKPVIADEQEAALAGRDAEGGGDHHRLGVTVGTSPSFAMTRGDQGFLLFSFLSLTVSIAFTSMVVAAVPALLAMRRTAISLAKLADTTREELPSTMAAIRLSGMEISDLTVELSDLSQEIADGVTKSALAVQAAEAGMRQIGALAGQKTMSMIEERANLPEITIESVVAGAVRKTSHVVGQVKKKFMNIFCVGGFNPGSPDGMK